MLKNRTSVEAGVRGSKSLYITSRISLCSSTILFSSVSCFFRSGREVNVLTEARLDVNLFTRCGINAVFQD